MLQKLRKKIYVNRETKGVEYFQVSIPHDWNYIFAGSDNIILEKLADGKGIIVRSAVVSAEL